MPERVAIVGTSASGISTLAKALSSALRAPHVELDALDWLPGRTQRDPDAGAAGFP